MITDRYVDSLLAYQGAGRALEPGDVELVARWATRDLRPHLTVVLDLDPAHGLSRFAERDRIEGESPDFHRPRPHGVPDARRRRPRPLPRGRREPAGRRDRRGRAHPARAAAGRGDAGDRDRHRRLSRSGTSLVGQRRAIEALRAAASGHGMSHAFLFTGPPGSGRSNAAIAFAAALAVRGAAARLRRLPLLPHRARRQPRRRHRRAHRQAVDRRRRGARPRPPVRARSGGPALAGDDRRGRRPPDRAGGERPAQGDRGAHGPHGVDAVRADRRGSPPDDPLALPAGHPGDAVGRGGGRVPHPCGRGRAPRSRRTALERARVTSAAPVRSPATRAPATGARRSCRSRRG